MKTGALRPPPQGEEAAAQAPLGSRHPSLREAITDAIRSAILTGRYRPGERLVEDRLAAEYGVSRNPVRESLRLLESEGLVEVVPRRGATVASFSDDEAREIIELRAALEGLSARLAARRCPPALREHVRGLLERGAEAAAVGDEAALRQQNAGYHALLASAGSNRFLTEVMRSVRDRTFWITTSTRTWRGRQSWEEHAAILRAILERDEELAALLASRHVTNAGRAYLEEAREQPEEEAADEEA